MTSATRSGVFATWFLIGLLGSPTALSDPEPGAHSSNRYAIWPGKAPGERTLETGTRQPFRPGEHPPVLRIEGITSPSLQVFHAPQPRRKAGILILPGGGFGKVVTNKEGSEAAHWLNRLGISAFVLSYRTTSPDEPRTWFRPLQDSQRALRFVRHHAVQWSLNPARIGLLGFSAGGQVAAIHLANTFPSSYDLLDDIDTLSHRPDFALLIYPWNTLNPQGTALKPELTPRHTAPPTFLVHTDDDRSSSLGTLNLYSALKRLGAPVELHVYENGGHGYGMRTVSRSNIGSWPDRAADWLLLRDLPPPSSN